MLLEVGAGKMKEWFDGKVGRNETTSDREGETRLIYASPQTTYLLVLFHFAKLGAHTKLLSSIPTTKNNENHFSHSHFIIS